MSSGDKGPSHRARNCSISSRNLGHTNKARSMTSSTSGHAGHSALRHTPISSGSCESSLLGEHSGEMKGDESVPSSRPLHGTCDDAVGLHPFPAIFHRRCQSSFWFLSLYIHFPHVLSLFHIICRFVIIRNLKKLIELLFFKQVMRRCVGSVEYRRTSPFTGHHDNIRIHFLKELQFEFIDQF